MFSYLPSLRNSLPFDEVGLYWHVPGCRNRFVWLVLKNYGCGGFVCLLLALGSKISFEVIRHCLDFVPQLHFLSSQTGVIVFDRVQIDLKRRPFRINVKVLNGPRPMGKFGVLVHKLTPGVVVQIENSRAVFAPLELVYIGRRLIRYFQGWRIAQGQDVRTTCHVLEGA